MLEQVAIYFFHEVHGRSMLLVVFTPLSWMQRN